MKREQIQLELFKILSDYGDFFLTDYPVQSESKSIHPTIYKIMELIDKLVAELREEYREIYVVNLKQPKKENKES